jgi:hypothetical protein
VEGRLQQFARDDKGCIAIRPLPPERVGAVRARCGLVYAELYKCYKMGQRDGNMRGVCPNRLATRRGGEKFGNGKRTQFLSY